MFMCISQKKAPKTMATQNEKQKKNNNKTPNPIKKNQLKLRTKKQKTITYKTDTILNLIWFLSFFEQSTYLTIFLESQILIFSKKRFLFCSSVFSIRGKRSGRNCPQRVEGLFEESSLREIFWVEGELPAGESAYNHI